MPRQSCNGEGVVHTQVVAPCIHHHIWYLPNRPYLVYKFDMEAVHNSPDDLKTYLGKLAYQLIHDNFLGQGMAMRNEDNGNPSGQV